MCVCVCVRARLQVVMCLILCSLSVPLSLSQWQEELRASEAKQSRQLQDIQKELVSSHLQVDTPAHYGLVVGTGT